MTNQQAKIQALYIAAINVNELSTLDLLTKKYSKEDGEKIDKELKNIAHSLYKEYDKLKKDLE